MLTYLRGVLGVYTSLSGDGVASLDIEYIVGAIILIMSLQLLFKLLLIFVRSLFRIGNE